ncbi:MAG TPA: class I SAM-dependent methyltransferase [Fimbriimonadaceae bacterium]|jgi:SAM-dependent methyltransferase
MYRRPKLYDAIYAFKDYEREATIVRELANARKQSPGNTLLDIACGTGAHILHLKKDYECTGIDLSPFLLKAAAERNPECKFIEGDMRFQELGQWFDVVICLFSAIGYVKTFDALESTLAHFYTHTAPGGVCIVEPWLFPENFRDGFMSLDTVDLPDYKVARMITNSKVGDISVMDMHFMLGCSGEIEYWETKSELGLFTEVEYREAMTRAGFEVEFDEKGLWSRGLFIGKKSL